MTDQELDARFKALEDRFDHLIKFMVGEFEAVRRELGALERRVGFLGEVTSALVKQDVTRETEMGQIRGAQAGQQRAIEDLDRRLRRLEDKNGSSQKP